MKRFRVIVDTGFSGAQHEDEAEFTDKEWAEMAEDERQQALDQACQTAVANFIEVYTEEVQ